jgi:hypothetical protein
LKLPRKRILVALAILPLALLMRGAAFAAPGLVELLFARGLYPRVARLLGLANSLLPLPAAELAVLAGGVMLLALTVRWWRDPQRNSGWAAAVRTAALAVWTAAGVALLLFLFAWGFNYARPPLRDRLALDLGDLQPEEVLALAERFVAQTNSAYEELTADPAMPTSLPYVLAVVDRSIDASYRRLALPGDAIGFATSPAKELLSSSLFSRLGISGIFIPFTGEPLFNRHMPAASKPIAIAHEKAHQRGITDEGEANLAAVLACLSAPEPYLRYAAALYASLTLLSAVSRYAPDEVQALAALWGPGPHRDLQAMREFWNQYRGRTIRAASRINDAYLRSNRVDGGVQSYGRVASMLVGMERAGQLPVTGQTPLTEQATNEADEQ